MNCLRWTPYWTRAFDPGRHIDGYCGTDRVARVVELERTETLPIMPHPSGRARRLFLAIANCGRGWEAVGAYASAAKARRECERMLDRYLEKVGRKAGPREQPQR